MIPSAGAAFQGAEPSSRLPLYQALLECTHRDGPRLPRGAAASIWHAIDTLRAAGGRETEIRILEQVSVEVHLLRQRLDRLDRLDRLGGDEGGDTAPRARIAALTGQWVDVAVLRA
jgi:hypothetical protein